LNLLRRRMLDDASAMPLMQNLESNVAAAASVADDLLQLTGEHQPVLRPVKLRALVEEVHGNLLTRLSSQGVTTTIDVADHVEVAADRDMLRQAILRLTANALDAMPTGGELVVTSCVGSRGVELEIADNGNGLSDEARTRAFEPFFTTKPAGTGLGLAIVRRLVTAHGGDVTVANCPDGGAAVTLCFPRQSMQAAA
jgi:signal transduction histidine kinase